MIYLCFVLDLSVCVFQAWSVPEVLRPLYESSKILAQKTTVAVRTYGCVGSFYLVVSYPCCCSYILLIFCMQALRHIRQIAQETSGEIQYGGGRQPAVLRTFSQRLCR